MIRKTPEPVSPKLSPLPQRAASLLAALRAKMVRTHCITNSVVQKITADGLGALGCLPSMTANPLEIENFVARCDVLLINLGTLDPVRIETIETAIEKANKLGKPWVLDPVLCDVSSIRRDFAKDLLALNPKVVRGNSREMASLPDIPTTTVRVETGEIDTISYQGRTLHTSNGHPLMARITGTGCLSGAMMAAFLAVEHDPFIAATAAMLTLNIAAELAGEISRGPGTMAVDLIDELHLMAPHTITTLAKVAHD